MMFTNKKWLQTIIVLIPISLFLYTCTSDKSMKPEIQAFREQMVADYNRLKSILIPAMGTDNPVEATGDIIEHFLQELRINDRRIYGIGFLGTTGEYLTGIVVDNNTGKLIKDRYKDMNFHSFKVVEQIASSRRIMQEKLYLQSYEILAIGFPVIKEGEMLGILCFTFKSHEFEKKWGLSEKEFLGIDFGEVQ